MYWYNKASFYHIYPLGYCGKLYPNDYTSEPTGAIRDVINNIPHIKEMGCNAVYFGPVFESVKHGYDTVDYTKIDRRLGTNADFAMSLHVLRNIGIVLTVVFVVLHAW